MPYRASSEGPKRGRISFAKRDFSAFPSTLCRVASNLRIASVIPVAIVDRMIITTAKAITPSSNSIAPTPFG